MIVAVEELNIKLYKLFIKQLEELNIGYDYNKNRMAQIMDLVNSIDYIQHRYVDKRELQKILNLL